MNEKTIPICFITPNNFDHHTGDGIETRKHNVSKIHPVITANRSGTNAVYVLEEVINEQENQ